jgi:hypothetical protein
LHATPKFLTLPGTSKKKQKQLKPLLTYHTMDAAATAAALAKDCRFARGWFFYAEDTSCLKKFGQNRIIAPNGTVFKDSLNSAVVFAANSSNVSIDLAPYFQLFPEGPEAMQNAADWNLHQFGTWMAKRDGDKLLIWDPFGMIFQSFVSVAVYHRIDITTIGDPVFLEKRQYAEDQLHLLPGWSATLDSNGKHDIFSPEGDYFSSKEKAGVAAGVIRPSDVVRLELNAYRTIVREVHPRVTQRVMPVKSFLRLANVEYNASSSRTVSTNFLGGQQGLSYENLYRASNFANNADALEQAARNAGVTDIDEYRRRMRQALAQRIQDGVYDYDGAAAFGARDDNEEAVGAAAVARVDAALAFPPIDANGVVVAALPAFEDVAAVDADEVGQIAEV